MVRKALFRLSFLLMALLVVTACVPAVQAPAEPPENAAPETAS